MIGRKIIAIALLLPAMVASLPNHVNAPLTFIAGLKGNGFIQNGKLEIPVSKYCDPPVLKSSTDKRLCTSWEELAKNVHRMESVLFCSQIDCDAKYNPSIGLCQCSWGSAQEMDEDYAWPDKNCKTTTTCYVPFQAHWNPSTKSCTCAIDTFHKSTSLPVLFRPGDIKDRLYGPSKEQAKLPSIDMMLRKVEDDIKRLAIVYKAAATDLASRGGDSTLSGLDTLKKMYQMLAVAKVKLMSQEKKADGVTARQAASGAISLAPLPTYIPPPNTEVTQELIQESLLLQPQKVAMVGSVVPQFAEGVITFLVQLDGPISQTLSLNATDTLPCENIGVQPQPNLILVPKSVRGGTSQTIVPTCLVIAVNMYSPQYITYWIQKEDGSVFSLLSDNKIRAIDQLDTSQPASIVIQVASTDTDKKRDKLAAPDVLPSKRRQIFSISCKNSCPLHHMERINSSDGYCGCMFKGADQEVDLTVRGVEEPTPYTATMTAAACAAMTCINNGGKPALFNPFTATCWCAILGYVETNENAYSEGM